MVAGLASLALVSVIGWQALNGWGDQGATVQLAQKAVPLVNSTVVAEPAGAALGSPPMLRDPQLDALLAAHRQFGGTSALQMPAGFLRNATFEGARH
jgi:sigma-E factor negative regulatory protein RseA